MELRQLKYFLAVADQRSFVSAANVLYISRQAISKAVAQLEQELQVELFMRDSSGAFLTPAGVLFYDRIRGTVTELEQIRKEMLDYGAHYRQRVRLAFAIGTLTLFESTLQRFAAAQKNADIEYEEYPEEQCCRMLLERQADAAVLTQLPELMQLEGSLLARCEVGALMPERSPLAEKPLLPQQALGSCELAAHTEFEWIPDHKNIRYRGYDYYRLMQLAVQGKCVLLLPELLAAAMPAGSCWRQVEGAPQWSVYAVRAKSPGGSSLSNTLLDELQQALCMQSEGGGAPR